MNPRLSRDLVEIVKLERFNHFGSTEIYTFTIGPDPRKPGCAGRAGTFGNVQLVNPDAAGAPMSGETSTRRRSSRS